MRIFGRTFFEKVESDKSSQIEAFTKPDFPGYSPGSAWAFSYYNGEKNLGSIGPVTEYNVDGKALRTRGWEAYLTNETVQTIINKMVVWVIGRGLRLQAEPKWQVLNLEGINVTKDQAQEWSDAIEAYFSLYKEQNCSTASEEKNLSQTESTAFRNAKIGGDVLVIYYFDGQYMRTKLIDGCHVKSAQGGDDWNPRNLGDGRRIINGVEMDENGKHIAYWVQNADLKWDRILAYSPSTGLRIAKLLGATEYRLDYARCVPAISGVLEVLAAMDRYKLATLETAEETSKVAYQVNHGTASTGENPMAAQLKKARDAGGNDGTIPVDDQLKAIADKVQVSTNKQTFNMPIDSKLNPLDKSKSELYFKDFYSVFFDIVCAAVNMPPNVAMSKYDSSFSSARAAIKDWEHTLLIDRYNFGKDFLQPIYEAQLYVWVRMRRIQLPGYLNAFTTGNKMVIAAYCSARWVGDSVPHIDPLKEVKAVRELLGPAGAALPLIDHEGAVELLDRGNAKAILQQFAKEIEEAEKLGVEVPQAAPSNEKGGDNETESEG